MNELSEKELQLLNLLAAQEPSSQREVASASGLSLGFVNSVIKRLATTGYIKIQNLSSRKMRYLVTPKGLAETGRQSYDYIRRTIQTFNACLERVRAIIDREIEGGARRFTVVGTGEVADLVEIHLRELAARGVSYVRVTGPADAGAREGVVLDCRPFGPTDTLGVSVLRDLMNL